MSNMIPFQSKPLQTQILVWQPPPNIVFKLNTDAFIQPSFRNAYGGGFIWNNLGIWLRGFVCNIGYCSILQGEAWALLHGLRIAENKGIPKLHMKCDNKVLINIIFGEYQSPASCQSIINSVKNEMKHFLKTWYVMCTVRPTSLLTSFLTTLAISTLVFTYSSLPSWLLHDSIVVTYFC